MLGPTDRGRAVAADQLLPAARIAARAAGVTRLAELTRLDCLGLPVWQAVRPMSRALSVHQGKGVTDDEARLGALLEAVESHSAETFDAEGPVCRFGDLPPARRAPDLSDFAADRSRPPRADRDFRWAEAVDLLTGDLLHLPFDIVSLDLSRGVPSPFDRASNGVAVGATSEEAVAVALQEFVERDAVIEWSAGGLVARMRTALDLDTIPFDWMRLWRDRLGAAGIAARLHFVPSITGTPVVVCELNDPTRSGSYRAVHGRGCHPDPELALFKALAEALQGRATYIAGAREDLLPSYYAPSSRDGVRVAFGLPLPPGSRAMPWSAIAPGPAGAAGIGEALARAGYPRIAIVELARPQGLAVVRAFVCGLGSIRRRRRPPS